MDSGIANEILEELSSVMQRVEAQSAAILEFVKEKGIATADELAPYLDRANAASSVRWRATRVRLKRLLAGLEKREQQSKDESKEKRQPNDADNTTEPMKATKPENTEQPTTQKPNPPEDNQDEMKPSRPVQSPKAEVSGTHGSQEPRSRPQEQEQRKTASSNRAENPPDKADRRDAA